MTLKIGSKAPNFSLETQTGDKLSLSDIKENYIVLYFYPKDDTPGCTIEAIEFTKSLKDFTKASAKVIGVSGGTLKTKQKFCQKHGLEITLLNDEKFELADKYKVYGEKKFMGRTYMGISRTTFILDKQRTISHIFETVKPEGHAKEVLEKIRELGK